MSPVDLLALATAGLGTALWWFAYGTTAASLWCVPRLSERQDAAPAKWPSISVVVPARDEEATLGHCLGSLLDQDYDRLQVVAVNDRSSDGTGALIDALAQSDPRVCAVHVETLPPAWLGKVHALQAGSDAATGELLLFCDADIDHAPGLLRKAVALMAAEKLGLLTLFPRLRATGVMRPVMTAFGDGYLQRTLGNPSVVTKQGAHFGFGAFMLLRRSDLEATAGLSWLKLDVLDDLALAKLLGDAGLRCGFAVADESLSVQWYPTLSTFVRHTEKNFWGGMAGFSVARCLAMALLAGWGFTAPFAGLLVPGSLGIGLLAAAWVPVIANAAVGRRFAQRSFVAGLVNPFAQWILAAIMARAALVSIGRKEIVWRDTAYSVDDLRAGRRVSYP
ncbi:MAG: glycosyltransferase [Myxococcales bacterium]|nr:glycosyltransferase [Myxococcales bacterium]